MKKFLWIFLTAFMVVGFTSCDPKDSNGTELKYDVTAKAEGQVNFSWFNGGAEIDGNATIVQCNDSTKKLFTAKALKDVLSLTECLESENKKINEAANYVNKFIKVEGVQGNYHLSIKGYVKYGPMIFEINEEYPKDSIN